jgi:hypothetical protein
VTIALAVLALSGAALVASWAWIMVEDALMQRQKRRQHKRDFNL